MALVLKKSTTLNGESIFNGQIAVSLMATISAETGGNSYINQNILNQEVYNANKKQVRKDISDFQDAVYEIEDAIEEEKDIEKKKEE